MKYLTSDEAEGLFFKLHTARLNEVLETLGYLLEERREGFPRTLFEYDTDHNHAWYLLGLAYEKAGDLQNAASCFRSAARIWATDADSYVALSNTEPD